MIKYEVIEKCENEWQERVYSYLYALGTVMFKYIEGTEILSEEEINMIVNAPYESQIDGMILVAADRNRMQYNYSTFLENRNNVELVFERKRIK